MYIVALAWMYVVLMMSITESSVVAGVMTFVMYGVVPVTIILYVMGTPQRRRRRLIEEKLRHEQAAAAEAAAQAARLAPVLPPPELGATSKAPD